MVKQICLLLESTQCHMEGGFFSDWNLDNYVAKIIKSRYSHSLGDTVHKIYHKMDLLLFAEEDETPKHLLMSEDSNKSWKGKADRDEMGENNVSRSVPVSSENEPLQLLKNENGSFERTIQQEDRDKKNSRSQEEERKGKKIFIFHKLPPDLQCLGPKAERATRKKKRERASYDKVCETPATRNKVDDDHYKADGSRTCTSGSKALFQDDH